MDRTELLVGAAGRRHPAYDAREEELGGELMRELERRVLLAVLDRKWREHLYEMDYLREGIGLRAYSQRDPLVEYQREGFDMFAAMMDGIKEEAVGFLFNLEVEVEEEPTRRRSEEESSTVRPRLPSAAGARRRRPIQRQGLERASSRQRLTYSAPSEQARPRCGGTARSNADDPYAGVGPHALCPCGSGKKYKRCHGGPGGPTGLTAARGRLAPAPAARTGRRPREAHPSSRTVQVHRAPLKARAASPGRGSGGRRGRAH